MRAHESRPRYHDLVQDSRGISSVPADPARRDLKKSFRVVNIQFPSLEGSRSPVGIPADTSLCLLVVMEFLEVVEMRESNLGDIPPDEAKAAQQLLCRSLKSEATDR